jgi:hypothetical protein
MDIDELRLLALVQHLGCDAKDLEEGGTNEFVFGRRQVYSGDGEAELRQRSDQLRQGLDLLTGDLCNQFGVVLRRQGEPWTLRLLEKIGYRTLYALLVALDQTRNGYNTANFLHTMLERKSPRGPVATAARRAFEGKKYKEYRERHWTDSGTWRVLTDDEADKAMEDCLEEALQDEEMVPGSDSPYFDRERWKSDARQDGRGHCLSSRDGEENEETVTDPEDGSVHTFYLYRS